MADFHPTPTSRETVDPAKAARNSRYGLVLFAIYGSFYGAFMLVNAFAPQIMEMEVVSGINIAVSSGLLLIVAAFALALVYAWLCRSRVDGGLGRDL
jgi:uncharacterized membrane protein (DUF485 family)